MTEDINRVDSPGTIDIDANRVNNSSIADINVDADKADNLGTNMAQNK